MKKKKQRNPIYILELKGIPTSSGEAFARALIIKNPMRSFSQPKGDYIIIAEYTTPILNFLLSQAKGIVCTTGGITMHAAIIARELGIPCIVSVEKALSLIKKN